jgi:hypothetical protein
LVAGGTKLVEVRACEMKAIIKALSIGRASVYRVLEADGS